MDTRKYKTLNKNFLDLYKLSFPKDERFSISFLTNLIKNYDGELINYYDNNNFIGFTLSAKFDQYICLIFFATNPEFRNQGYGKKILDAFKIENENQLVFLNCELPENTDSNNIKYRRYSFYKRNGFILTPILLSYKNIDYLTLTNQKLDINELIKVLIKYKCDCKLSKINLD